MFKNFYKSNFLYYLDNYKLSMGNLYYNEKQQKLLCFCLCLYFAGVFIFMWGFLPVKSSIAGHASHADLPTQPNDFRNSSCFVLQSLKRGPLKNNHVYKRLFRRVVFVVIDALRADFIPSNYSLISHPHKFPDVTMPYVQSLMSNGQAKFFLSKAFSPTVTLARIKSLISGTVSTFLDVLLNLGASSFKGDNFIYQAKQKQMKLVFYGDETWLKLFPDAFIRSDGTNSFFVTDYTEVDRNVTRYIAKEMNSHDWDVLILHYLGVDHIGHLAGPTSPLLVPKLKEMDKIIEFIHESLMKSGKPSGLPDLIILTGDHGMTPSGSHGGVSEAELMTPLLFITSTQWKGSLLTNEIQQVSQIDIVPTLAALLALPIPQNNYGYIISDLLNAIDLPPDQHLYALHYNVMQILKLLKYDKDLCTASLQKAIYLHSLWLTNKSKNLRNHTDQEKIRNQSIKLYVNALQELSSSLISESTVYDNYAIFIGLIIALQMAFFIMCIFFLENSKIYLFKITTFDLLLIVFIAIIHLISCYICNSCLCENIWISIATVFLIAVSLKLSFRMVLIARHVSVLSQIQKLMASKTTVFITCSLLLHTVSFFSSSFIEEEHQTWYFFSTSFLFLVAYRKYCAIVIALEGRPFDSSSFYRRAHNQLRASLLKNTSFSEQTSTCSCFPNRKTVKSTFRVIYHSIIVIFIARMLRYWNRTGDKWAHLPDTGDWLNKEENKILLSLFIFISQLLVVYILWGTTTKFESLFLFSGMTLIYIYRSIDGTLLFPYDFVLTFDKTFVAKLVYFHIGVISLTGIAQYIYRIIKLKMCQAQQTLITATKFLLCSFVISWILLATLLHRPHNISMLFGIIVQENFLSHIVWQEADSPIIPSFTYVLMAMSSFFFQGNSNSISTIDVSSGYVGVTEYNQVTVGILMLCNTYSGIIFWLLMFYYRLCENSELMFCSACARKKYTHNMTLSMLIFISYRITIAAAYLIVTYSMRYHLFIWSVFIPKLLYEVTHTVIFVLFFIVCITVSFVINLLAS